MAYDREAALSSAILIVGNAYLRSAVASKRHRS